jgi:hypothetical protein
MYYLIAKPKPSSAMMSAALAEEARLPENTEPWWVCRSGMLAMTAALDGNPQPLQLKPASEWPALRKAAREQVAGMVAH